MLKFIYSEKATNFCEISTVDLSYVVTVKSTVEISQNFVAFSEYRNFTIYLFATTNTFQLLKLDKKEPNPSQLDTLSNLTMSLTMYLQPKLNVYHLATVPTSMANVLKWKWVY